MDLFGLRPYQIDAVAKIEKHWSEGKQAVLCQLPTGGGKSRIIRQIVDDYSQSKKVIYLIAHRNTLVNQLSKEVSEAGIKHGIIQAGSPYIRYRVQVCSMQTLVRRLDKMAEPEIIITDECHHIRSNSYMNILNKWPNANILGMTATPQRIDGKGFDDIFDELILGPSMKDLIAAGFLSDYEYYAPAIVDMEGVKKTGGDYNAKESVDRVDRKVITGSAVEHYRRYADHQPAIASCVSIAHSEHVAQEFRYAGYKAIAVNSTMDQMQVQRAINGLKDGTTEILTQCEMLGEGVDIPAATCLIGLRPTASLTIYLQHCGRVLRRAPGKDKAIILDHVGNWQRFGLPDDDREWTLEGKKKGAKESSKYKRCPECLRPVAVSARKCQWCGYVWMYEAQERIPTEVEGTLVSVKDRKDDENQDLYRAIARGAHNLKQAIKVAESMGYKHTSAFYVWTQLLHLGVDSVV
ncbi:MAG: DEAD/DEAH box helicase family protein [Sphaerochaeta sp.]|uniref:DEAD/DEAH box helicase n=1 Tax=Sphaerochaeta sp. TaxID=1972642 RepID=UPI003D0AD50D